MNKTELINAMAAETGMSKKNTKIALEAFLEVTKQALKKEKKLSLPGFATWKVVERPAQKARNVRTGASINVPAKNVVKFRAGSLLAQAVK